MELACSLRTLQVLKEHGIDKVVFVDNTPLKQGTLFCEMAVIAPKTLAACYKADKNMVVIITAGEETVMIQQLQALEIKLQDILACKTSIDPFSN